MIARIFEVKNRQVLLSFGPAEKGGIDAVLKIQCEMASGSRAAIVAISDLDMKTCVDTFGIDLQGFMEVFTQEMAEKMIAQQDLQYARVAEFNPKAKDLEG